MSETTTAIAMMTGLEIPVLAPLVLELGAGLAIIMPVGLAGEPEKTAEIEGEGVLSPVGLLSPVDCVAPAPVAVPPPAVV